MPMSTMHQFYVARAAEAKRDADHATLANVRNRFLASAATWTSLAARASRVDRMHAGLVAERAADRSAVAAITVSKPPLEFSPA